jgi:dihydrofolate synthase / folylpolyglutamate synthase
MTAEMLPDYPAAKRYLFGLKHHGAKFGIDRMRLLSERLGHPERKYPVIHVAGTNGKGSVSAMVEAALRRAGLKVGLFTSPHLVRQGERIQVNREILHEDQILAYANELKPIAEELGRGHPDDHPSFFEFMTGMAFLHFARERVDAAVIEVGLGGRLDATNVVEPAVAAITSIGMDHCEMLGDTLAKIAAEKGGIIKPGCPVVIGLLPAEANAEIERIARERGATALRVEDVFGRDPQGMPQTNLEGNYQRTNAATAVLVCRTLAKRFPALTEEVVREALLQVDWAGRWQRMKVGERLLVLDASHNPDGAKCLEENLVRLEAETGRKPQIVAGTLGAFRAEALMPTVARYASAIHLVVPKQPRACSFEELEAALPKGLAGPVNRATVEAIFPRPGICSLLGDDPVVITGSIYLLGECLERLLHHEPINQGILQDW